MVVHVDALCTVIIALKPRGVDCGCPKYEYKNIRFCASEKQRTQ